MENVMKKNTIFRRAFPGLPWSLNEVLYTNSPQINSNIKLIRTKASPSVIPKTLEAPSINKEVRGLLAKGVNS